MVEEAGQVGELCRKRRVLYVINDRVDYAKMSARGCTWDWSLP